MCILNSGVPHAGWKGWIACFPLAFCALFLVASLPPYPSGNFPNTPLSPYASVTLGSFRYRGKTFRVEIKRGWKAGTKIQFAAAPSSPPSFPPSAPFPPVVFILVEARHRYFTRRGDDLVWRKGLSTAQVRRRGERGGKRDVGTWRVEEV